MKYDQTQKQFGQAVEAYNRSALFAQGEDLAWLVEAAAPVPTERALDIGTATGNTAFALAPHVRSVVGLDITQAMVERAITNARERGLSNFEGVVANAESLPCPDASHDLVVCRMTGHHFVDPARVTREIARVLRPGGRLVISDVSGPGDPALELWLNRFEQLRDPSHVKDWSEAEWQHFFTQAGFTFETVRTWPIPLELYDWTARQQTPPKRVAELESLLKGAAPAVRELLAIEGSRFCLPGRLMRGVLARSTTNSGGVKWKTQRILAE